MTKIFKSSKQYKIIAEIDNRISYYTCEILEEDDIFVKLKDRFGKVISLNKNSIKSFRELLNER